MMSHRAVMVLTLMIGLLVTELGVRYVEPSLPDLAAWPTPEAELKSDQIRDLDERVDLVIIGSSVSEAAIDPDRLPGISAYNAALPFSSLKSNTVWLEEHVLPWLSPSVVMIGLSEWSLVSNEDPLYAPLRRIQIGSDGKTWWQASALLRRRSQLREWGETMQRMRTLESGLWTERGHQTGYYDGAIESIAGAQRRARSQPRPEQVEALQAIIRSIRDAGARPVILIEPRVCPPTLGTCAAESQVRQAVMAELAASDVDAIIDGNLVNWPAHMFADSAHFNRAGTLAFSEFISEQLRHLIVGPGEVAIEAEMHDWSLIADNMSGA